MTSSPAFREISWSSSLRFSVVIRVPLREKIKGEKNDQSGLRGRMQSEKSREMCEIKPISGILST